MSDDIFRWSVRAARRWPGRALTIGVAAASGVIVYAVHQGGSTPPRNGAALAPARATRTSLHPACTFLIDVVPAAGSVYLSTWGGPSCLQLGQLLQRSVDRALLGQPISVTVSTSTVDPTIAGPPACTQSLRGVTTLRVYPTEPDGDPFAQTVCSGLKYALRPQQKTS